MLGKTAVVFVVAGLALSTLPARSQTDDTGGPQQEAKASLPGSRPPTATAPAASAPAESAKPSSKKHSKKKKTATPPPQ